VDEAHGYKNLRTVSKIDGVAVDGSQHASDMDMKLAWLRERHGGRVATFATATPIANSVAEAYTMQRFLRPDLLDDAGLTDFDTWAATFGEVSSDLELAPDGSRFRMKARFAKFRNVPELLRIWHVSADIKTAEDLKLPTPDLRGGHAETVVVPANEQLREFMRELSDRADKVQARAVQPDEDNMLRVATHGRMAALDLRLLGRDPGEDGKLTAAANRIAATHHVIAERRYDDSDVPGSLQLVFSDLGTPTARGSGTGLAGDWNVYDQLKGMLIDRGVPAERIRFVHDARNDKEKGELFAACRNGRISVLIGSTEKMGVGTNVQARAVALHHLDCPWRPADIAQREGRILRQGNLNPEVEVIRYVAEGSFDAYLWQTVERKARFIGQVMRGSLDVREIEDIGETALSYSEVKALATGDPRILEKAKVDAQVTRLERLERSHTRNQRTLSATIDKAEKSIGGLQTAVAQIDQAIEHRVDTTGDRFAMTVGSTRWTSRADAAIALRNALAAIGGTNPDTTQYAAWDRPNHIGSLGGFDITATPRRFLEPHLSLELAGIPRSHIRVDYDELRADRPLGIVIQLENRVRDLERTRHKIEDEAAALAREAEQARADHGKPFTRREALDTARARSAQLAAELAEQDKQREQAAAPSTSACAPAASTPTASASLTPPPAAPPVAAADPATEASTAALVPSGRDWSAQPPRSPDEHTQMAKDTAAATFAARAPITATDRPSVERELRHVHGDTTYYSTVHAARDALAAARAAADTNPSNPEAAERADAFSSEREQWREQIHPHGDGPYTTDGRFAAISRSTDGLPQGGVVGGAHQTRTQADAYVDALNAGDTHDHAQFAAYRADPTGYRRGSLTAFGQALLDNTPPGGWTDADRVTTPPAPDTSSYPSAQRYPVGTPLTVHAVTADGTVGRRLGHGVVTDHPGPEHVTVESPYGTRRVAHLNQVSQPHQPTPPPQANPPAAAPSPANRSTAMNDELARDTTEPDTGERLPVGYRIAEHGVPGVPPRYQVLHGGGRAQQFIGIRDTREEAAKLAHQHWSRSEAEHAAPLNTAAEQRMNAAEDRWADACRAVDPRVVADPHWPALARSLDRIDAAGHDIEQLLREVTAQRALPSGSPARSLDYRLADAAPVATAAPSQPWTAAPGPAQPSGPAAPVSPPQIGRGGPAR
jgi:hypothetical protein